jgi:hypothetical protein
MARSATPRKQHNAVAHALLALLACAVSACLTPALAASDDEQVFTGRLASKDIVLQLLPQNGTASANPGEPTPDAQYFYRPIGTVIPLVKSADGWLAECKADFRNMDCSQPTGYWRLPAASSPPAAMRAAWKATPAGRVTEVELKPAAPSTDASMNRWSQLLGTGPTKLTRSPEKNKVTVGVLADTRSGMFVPQLVSGYSPEVTARFNAAFRSQLVNHAASNLENASLGGEEGDESAVQYQSPNWLVWGGTVGGYFGGAHPSSTFDFTTFDMRTGEAVDARTALFKHLSDAELNQLAGSTDNFEVPAASLKGKRVVEALVLTEIGAIDKQASDASGTRGETDEGCFEEFRNSATDANGGKAATALNVGKSKQAKKKEFRFGFDLMLQPDGLAVVSTDFSEAARNCRGVMFTIPWSKARPYLDKPL